MKIKDVIAEDFVNYKLPSMFIISSVCNWKCCIEQGLDISVCQNQGIAKQKTLDISVEMLYNMFTSNPITEAIVIGGLEPFDQFEDIIEFVAYFREKHCNNPIIIYTGYYPNEVTPEIEQLKNYNNIIIKFGRYVPNRPKRYDDILGIELVSDNQYAEKIS